MNAIVHCALGRIEKSLDLLELAYETRDAKVLWMGVDPELDPVHGHPRFNDLLRKLNHRLAALPSLPAHSHTGQESIAVLPFKILSSPGENTPGFSGSWNNYPFFKNGAIGVVSIGEGFFMVRDATRKIVP